MLVIDIPAVQNRQDVMVEGMALAGANIPLSCSCEAWNRGKQGMGYCLIDKCTNVCHHLLRWVADEGLYVRMCLMY